MSALLESTSLLAHSLSHHSSSVCSASAYSAADDPLSIKNGLTLRVDAGLAASYPGTGTTWCDLSGNGNHMYWSSDASPLYTTFNGYGVLRTTPTIGTLNAISTQSYNSLPTGSQAFSVVAVFKPNSLTTASVLVTAGSPSLTSGQLVQPVAINPSTKYAGGLYDGLGTWTASVGTAPSTSQYVVMVTTYDGTRESVYINGVLEKSAIMTPAIPVSSSNKVVLGAPWNATQNMDADVGVVLMYNRALSSSEAYQISSAYASRFSIPILGERYFRCICF